MKRPEGGPRHNKAPIPEPTKKVFTEAQRKHPHDFVKQAELIVAAHRPAGLPENFQPVLMAGGNRRDRNEQSPWDQFLAFLTEEGQRKQQASAEEQERLRQQEVAELQQRQGNERRIKENLVRFEQRIIQAKTIETTIGRQTCQELEQEAQRSQMGKMAEDLERLWKNSGTSIKLEKISTPDVKPIWKVSQEEWGDVYNTLSREHLDIWSGSRNKRLLRRKNDLEKMIEFSKESYWSEKSYLWGSTPEEEKRPEWIANRSQVGWKLSYSYEGSRYDPGSTTYYYASEYDSEPWGESTSGGGSHKTIETASLFFGFGYCGGGKYLIIPEARAFVQNQDFQDGVKSYFVQAKGKGGRLQAYIPHSYPNSWQTFEKYLIKGTEAFYPR